MLSKLGLRLLARRDAVPPARYVRFVGVSAFDPDPSDDGDQAAIRHREHHLGVNRVFERLAQDLQRAGGRLALRRNEAESTRRFRYEGGAAWIRPDGSGLLELDGERLPFLLEYDRGTLDGGDFAAKFGGYRRYFAAEAWRQDFDSAPVLLFVCADDRAERRVASAIRAAAPDLPVLSTSEWRYESDIVNPAGLVGPIWREAGTGSVSRVALANGLGTEALSALGLGSDESKGEDRDR